MHNVPKWSDTLYKSCRIYCKIFKSVSDHFGTLCIKRLSQVYSIQQQTMVSVLLWNVVMSSELQVLFEWAPLGSSYPKLGGILNIVLIL